MAVTKPTTQTKRLEAGGVVVFGDLAGLDLLALVISSRRHFDIAQQGFALHARAV